MKIIDPSYKIETPIHGEHGLRLLQLIEAAARTCYKSEGKITSDSAREFVRKIAQVKKHVSVTEHASATVRFIVDRGVSHELVRHRLAAFSQESTRYCNYCSEKFGREITVIRPPFFENHPVRRVAWMNVCMFAEQEYFRILNDGGSPQEARCVLPNSLKTEVVMSCNMREWRHVFTMRTSPAAHPQMRQIMCPLLVEFKQHLPELFDDL